MSAERTHDRDGQEVQEGDFVRIKYHGTAHEGEVGFLSLTPLGQAPGPYSVTD